MVGQEDARAWAVDVACVDCPPECLNDGDISGVWNRRRGRQQESEGPGQLNEAPNTQEIQTL